MVLALLLNCNGCINDCFVALFKPQKEGVKLSTSSQNDDTDVEIEGQSPGKSFFVTDLYIKCNKQINFSLALGLLY